MRGYKPKILKYTKKCRYCNIEFLAADVKAYTCLECRKPKQCKCGCGAIVKTPGRFYSGNHERKGKTYLEIYGTSNPGCGHKKGEANAAKRLDIRKKISEGVLRSYENNDLIQLRREKCAFLTRKGIDFACKFEAKDKRKYRSRFEVEVADFLFDHNYQYEYEHRITMDNNKLKVVDFVVNDVLIEVTGYAFDDWQQNFNKNIIQLRQSVKNKIVIITYEKHTKALQSLVDINKLQDIIILGPEYKTKLIELCKQ